jgi:hypothetical protein
MKQPYKFVALINGAAQFWANGETLDDAVKGLCKEVRECGIKTKTSFSFMVYTVDREQGQLQWCDQGVFELVNDKNIGHARPAYWITDVDVRRPLSSMRLNNWRKGYRDDGKAMDALLALREDH